MNDDEVSNKIKQLRKLEPSQEMLSVLREDIYSRIKSQRSSSFLDLTRVFSIFNTFLSPRPIFLYGATVLILLLVTVAALNMSFLLRQYRMAAVETQIAFSGNKYEKAQLVLSFSQNQLISLKQTNQQGLTTEVKYLTDATFETNRRLASLNLMGEKGKYTKNQCLDIYKNYQDYLEQLKQTVKEKMVQTNDLSTQRELQSLLNQITQFEKQAETRLKLY